jgi:hypothetical protein
MFRGLPALLTRECEAVHGALLAQTAGILADVVLTPEQLQLDLERGRRLLDLRIPPVEEELRPALDRTPPALSAPRVFSSCWAAYYLGVEVGKPARENLAQTSAALLDSLDAAEAIRAWERAT